MASGVLKAPAPPGASHATPAAQGGRPERIGDRYRVLDELRGGGMAAVYRVRDAGSTRDVALKQLT